ncbi:MAG: hypothetical protein ACTSPD_10540 [Promethearchaeota archaeon]
MNEENNINTFGKILLKSEMYSFYLNDPKEYPIEREINNTKMRYFYFDKDFNLITEKNELLNGCLLLGDCYIIHNDIVYDLNQFDFFFLPPKQEITIKIKNQSNNKKCKICLYNYKLNEKINADFEVQHFSFDKFLPRGEYGSKEKMATYRTVWTAIKNGYFMSGFTNVPNESLKQGVITSVNLERINNGTVRIYPHIHPNYPEVYIMCIDDPNYSISQYLINIKGKSVIKDLSDGEGLFFPGNLAHSNFSRPFYKDLKYCMYMWIIPTFGKIEIVSPITLQV